MFSRLHEMYQRAVQTWRLNDATGAVHHKSLKLLWITYIINSIA